MKHSEAADKKNIKGVSSEKQKSDKPKSMQDIRASLLQQHYNKQKENDLFEDDEIYTKAHVSIERTSEQHELQQEIKSLKNEVDHLRQFEIQQHDSNSFRYQTSGVLDELLPDFIHEFSSPLSSFEYSLTSLMNEHKKVMLNMLQISSGSASNQTAAELYQIIQGIQHFSVNGANSLQFREIKKRLIADLTPFKFKNTQRGADLMICAGMESVDDKLKNILGSSQGELYFDMFVSQLAILQSFSIMESAKLRSNHLISSLKNYTRKQPDSQPELFDLKDSIEVALSMLAHRLRSRNFTFNYAVSCSVFGDIQRLAHVWINLLSNAIEATNAKGSVDLCVQYEGSNVIVKVQDNGCGIAKDQLSKIFEPYYTTKKKQGGTGIGLDICKKYLEEMNAGIEVSSEPGKTEFNVRIKSHAKSK